MPRNFLVYSFGFLCPLRDRCMMSSNLCGGVGPCRGSRGCRCRRSCARMGGRGARKRSRESTPSPAEARVAVSQNVERSPLGRPRRRQAAIRVDEIELGLSGDPFRVGEIRSAGRVIVRAELPADSSWRSRMRVEASHRRRRQLHLARPRLGALEIPSPSYVWQVIDRLQ